MKQTKSTNTFGNPGTISNVRPRSKEFKKLHPIILKARADRFEMYEPQERRKQHVESIKNANSLETDKSLIKENKLEKYTKISKQNINVADLKPKEEESPGIKDLSVEIGNRYAFN